MCQKQVLLETWTIKDWNEPSPKIKPLDFKEKYLEGKFEMTKPESPGGSNISMKLSISKFGKKVDKFKSVILNLKYKAANFSLVSTLLSEEEINFDINDVKDNKVKTLHSKIFRWETVVPMSILFINISLFLCTDEAKQDKSTKKQRYTGIKKPSNTCYMNVIIQMLYYIPAFRRFIYTIPTNRMPKEERMLPAALQNLFCNIFKAKGGTVTIDNLLSVFNMERSIFIEQDDSHQFLLTLLNDLKDKCGLSKQINNIFGFESRNGKTKVNEEMLSWSICIYPGKTFEEDIRIDRAPMKTETGEEIGDSFISLPKMLIIHINLNKNSKGEKVMPKVKFPENLDLSEYVENDDYKDKSSYSLYCIVAHFGNVSSGHFMAFIKPNFKNTFYAFNDESVTKKSSKYMERILNNKLQECRSCNSIYPYILVYLRNDCKKEMGTDKTFKIPQYIKDGPIIEEEKLIFTVRTKMGLARNIDEGWIGFQPLNERDNYRVEADNKDTYKKLYQIVAAQTNKSNFRLWIRNKNSFLGEIIPNTDEKKLVDLNDDVLFIDELDYTEEFDLKSIQLRIFLVFYDHTEKKFEFITTRTVSKEDTVASITQSTRLLLRRNNHNIKEDQNFDIYLDNFTGTITELTESSQFGIFNIKQGSILLFEKKEANYVNYITPAPVRELVYEPSQFFESEREVNLKNYYEQKFSIWTFRVLFFNKGNRSIAINFPYKNDIKYLAKFLAKCNDEEYDPNKDEVLIFNVEYVNYPKVRPSIISLDTAVAVAFKNVTAFYFYIAHNCKGKILTNNYSYAAVRVSVSENGYTRSAMYETVVELPFTPRKVAESLNLKLPQPTRIRHLISSNNWTRLEMDTEINERFVHIRFEKDHMYKHEITSTIGEYTKVGVNIYNYGESFLLPVEEYETFDAIIDKFQDAVEDYQSEIVIIDSECKIVESEYFQGSCNPIIEAIDKNYSICSLGNPEKYDHRQNNTNSRF